VPSRIYASPLLMKASEAIIIGMMAHEAYAMCLYGYKPPSPEPLRGLNIYNAEWIAIIRIAISEIISLCHYIGRCFPPDASIPQAKKNPLTWQKFELLCTGPEENVTMGYTMNQSALNISL
jgi:hypothetical protein